MVWIEDKEYKSLKLNASNNGVIVWLSIMAIFGFITIALLQPTIFEAEFEGKFIGEFNITEGNDTIQVNELEGKFGFKGQAPTYTLLKTPGY